MKRTKLEKGITLIALIITIVVLLILAVVSIGAIQESKIIAHAQNAASDYKTKADEENTILEGYLATIEENIPGEEESEPVSIVGTYGDTVLKKENYYIFNEDGTGKYFEYKGAEGVVEKNFTYTLDAQNGTIILDDETRPFTFYVAKDSSGNIVNRVVCVEEWGDGTFMAYTINGYAGLPNIDGTIYNEIEKGYGEDIETVSFTNGKCIVQYEDGTTGDYGYYFKIGDYIYIEEGEGNKYYSAFQIIDNKLKNLCS